MITKNNFFGIRRTLVDVQNGVDEPVSLTLCPLEFVALVVQGTGVTNLPLLESADGVNFYPFSDLSGNDMVIDAPGIYKLIRVNTMIKVDLTTNTSTDLMVYVQ